MKLLLLTLCVGLISALPSKLIRGESYGANPEELGDYYEGDIMLAPGQSINDLKNGLVNERYRWSGNEVPYVFEDGFTEEELASIRTGFAEYHAKTCIRFVERTDQNDYIRITNRNTGCHSYVGRIGGGQQVNYQSGSCITRFGTVLHELYHALGFYHEQSRWDRDDYVTIVFDNINPNYDNNFNIYPQSTADGFGQPYDYGSMMHYSKTAFSINGEDTIVPKDPEATIGQRVGFSDIDLIKVNAMYNC